MCGWRQRHNLSSGWITQQFVIKSFSKSVKFTFYDEKMEKSADRTFSAVEDFDKWVQQIITSNVGNLQNAAVSIFNIKPPFLPQHMICISFVAAKSLFLHLNVFQKDLLSETNIRICNFWHFPQGLSSIHDCKVK